MRGRGTAAGAPAPASERPPDAARGLDRLTLVAVIAIVVAAQAIALASLVRPPAPLFGGDAYYQMGCIRSIRASGDPMASCSVRGALPGYLPLHGTLVAGLSALLGTDAFRAMVVAAVCFAGLGVTLVFAMVRRRFGPAAGLVAAGLAALVQPGWIGRYTDFAAAVVAPLYLIALLHDRERRSVRSAALLGLAIAAAGYTHAVLFVGAVAVWLALAVLDLTAPPRAELGRTRFLAIVPRVAVTLALAALALGYWWKPIFVHHGRTSLHYTQWNGGPSLVTLADRLAHARDTLAAMAAIDGPGAALLLALTLAGAVAVVLRRAEPDHWLAGTTAVAAFAWVFHAFATQPLLGVNFVPDYVVTLLWRPAQLLLAGAGAAALIGWAGRSRAATHRTPAWPRHAARIAAVAMALGGGARAIADPSLEVGRTPLHPMYPSLQRWVETHTRPDDVFLSTNELSFALSALTGRKVVVTRRAQNDAFLDMDGRNRDAALILYGQDDVLRRRLLAEHGVGYLLWTDEWPSTEFYFDPQGRVVDYDDPLLFFQNPAHERALAEAGVRFRRLEGWVDPMLRGERFRRFPLTIVTPDNYTRPDRPWRPELDAMLERVWSYEEGGRTIATLDRVRTRPGPPGR